ncbi:aminotransferase class I/II-fold pyridoxal phosphate-dependent enzyme [Romboutsia weinsteinii]|uniref:Aminotransferase class I/II-fold pyridoxal phosphate-dependent enzyme n=1 Tax=Romboutsia weinsteinii TaxID=2020949 RepID=A0A371IZ86_9FIRM|nr:threonine-phosphate decarboxylase [Romboutsia weinsteinii]RDY25795.1 aminotransferase class I/II-fold pyridoxal phosphate-dependent enzyme [Romboutsia weinsteinii]
MKELGHGANVNHMASIYNKKPEDIIDFSSNINPKVIKNLDKYILEGLKECRSYPDINYTNLRNNISRYIDIDSKFIIPGNGATEIIYLLMKSINKRLAILNPTFSEYGRSAKLNNLEVVNLELNKEDNFSLDLETVKENIDTFDSLFICNPNNPNGKVQDLTDLLDLIIKNNKLLIVDETFMEFVENEEDYSLIKYVEKHENIFILKAVTKFFGMPGLRLGYGVTSNKEIISKIYEYKEPWTINSFADNLSKYIFEDKEYIYESKEYYIKERAYMVNALESIDNLTVYETDTNFILLKLHNKSAHVLKDELLKYGNILIRDASNFIGLDESFIRVAIKSHEDNKVLIDEMRKILGK